MQCIIDSLSVKKLPMVVLMVVKQRIFLKQVMILTFIGSLLGSIHFLDFQKNFISENATDLKIKNLQKKETVRKPSSESSELVENVLSVLNVKSAEIDDSANNSVLSQAIDCNFASKLKIKQSKLRLTGDCDFFPESIVNKTNGYQSNIFNLNHNFTTDFISLNSGENKIELKYKDLKNKEFTQEISITVVQ